VEGGAGATRAGELALEALARSLRGALPAAAVDTLLAPLRAELAARGSVAAEGLARGLAQLEDVMDAVLLLGGTER
jgi:hypothetical protein